MVSQRKLAVQSDQVPSVARVLPLWLSEVDKPDVKLEHLPIVLSVVPSGFVPVLAMRADPLQLKPVLGELPPDSLMLIGLVSVPSMRSAQLSATFCPLRM